MTLKFRVLAGLSEDQSSVPRTNLDSSQPTVIPAWGKPIPSSSLGEHARHAYMAHTHKKKINLCKIQEKYALVCLLLKNPLL